MVWMFIIGCVGFGVAWLVQEYKKLTDEDIENFLKQEASDKLYKLTRRYIEISKELEMLDDLTEYEKIRDELFDFISNNQCYFGETELDLIESIYDSNRANNEVIRIMK